MRIHARLPELKGRPIEISFRPALTSHRGRLLSRGGRGQEVHAGTFLRERRVVLDSGLRRDRDELARIFIHEIFHFVWLRLGNRKRRSYENLLGAEMRLEASGELGFSSEYRKEALKKSDLAARTRRWREYACESFCDTAAWIFGGGRHEEFTLPPANRRRRRDWFTEQGLDRGISV